MLTGYTNIDVDKIKDFASENPTWTKDHWADYFYPNRNNIPLNGTGRVMDPIGDRGDADIFYGLLSHLSKTDQKVNHPAHSQWNGRGLLKEKDIILSL